MLKCASTEWSCWYYPKLKDAVETWRTCTSAPGRLSGMILAMAETQRTLEKVKRQQSQGGQLALKTKATACCELEGPLHAASCCAPPLKPKQQEVRTAGVHISVLHVLVIGKNFHETSRLHARVYTWTDTAGKGLRMVPLSWWYKQFSHDSALFSLTTIMHFPYILNPPYLGRKALAKDERPGWKENVVTYLPFNQRIHTRNSWWQAWDAIRGHSPSSADMDQ